VDNDKKKPKKVQIYRFPGGSDLFRFIGRRWWIVVAVLAAGVGGGLLVAKKFRPRYRSMALTRLTSPSKAQIGSGEDEDTMPNASSYVREVTMGIKDVTVIGPLVDKYESLLTDKERANKAAFVDWVISQIVVEWTGGNNFEIRARAMSPELAQKLAAGMTKFTMDTHRGRFTKTAIEFARVARKQIERTSKAIKDVEDKMVKFLDKNPQMRLKSLDTDRIANVTAADRLRATKRQSVHNRSLTKLARNNPELRALLAQKVRLQRELKGLTQTTTGATKALTDALAAARQKLRELRSESKGDAHPVVKRVLGQIKRLNAKIAAAAPGQRTAGSAYETKVRTELQMVNVKIRRAVGKLARTIKKAPTVDKADTVALEGQWSQMKREHKRLNEQYTRFQEVAINADLKKNLRNFVAQKTAKLVNPAPFPEKPIGLTRKAIVVAISIISLLGGLVLTIGIGILDVRLLKPEQVNQAHPDLEVLAILHEHAKGQNGHLVRVDLSQDPAAAAAASAQAEGGKSPKGGIKWLKDLDLDSALDAMANTGGVEEKKEAWGDNMATGFFDANAPRALGASGRPGQRGGARAEDGAMVLAGAYGDSNGGSSAPKPPEQRVHTIPGQSQAAAPGLFVASAPRSKAAEQMRLLAARVQSELGENLRVVTIGSWESGSGRTTVAANLAAVLAEAQKRVLLIDACPSTAALTHLFGFEVAGVGLCDQLQRWLDKEAAPWDVVQVAENLSVMPAVVDPTTPAMPLLLSEAFVRMVNDMTKLYDVLVIDTEPLQEVSDSIVLKRLVDGYVMVTRRRRSTTRSLKEINTRLSPDNIFGVVFNQQS